MPVKALLSIPLLCLLLTACGGGGGATSAPSSGAFSAQILDKTEFLALSGQGHVLVQANRGLTTPSTIDLIAPDGSKTTLISQTTTALFFGEFSDSGEYLYVVTLGGNKYFQNGNEINYTFPSNFTVTGSIDDQGRVYGRVTDSSSPLGWNFARFDGTTLETSTLPSGTLSAAYIGNSSAQYLKWYDGTHRYLGQFNPSGEVTAIRDTEAEGLTLTSIQGTAGYLYGTQGNDAVFATMDGPLTSVPALQSNEAVTLYGTLADGTVVGNSSYSPSFSIYPTLERPICFTSNESKLFSSFLGDEGSNIFQVLGARGTSVVTRYTSSNAGVNGVAIFRGN